MAPKRPDSDSAAKAKKSSAVGVKKNAPPKKAIVNKQSLKAEKVEAPIFRHKIICSIGNLRSFGVGKIISHDDIARWVTVHGGKHVRQYTEDTTHLICSIEVFESAMRQNDGMNVGSLEYQGMCAIEYTMTIYTLFMHDFSTDPNSPESPKEGQESTLR